MEGSFPAGIVGIYHDDGGGMGKNLKLVVRGLIMGRLRIRNHIQRKQLVNKKYFRVHYSGAYALWQLDFGLVGSWQFILLLGCVDRLVNYVYYKPVIPKKEKWSNGIAY